MYLQPFLLFLQNNNYLLFIYLHMKHLHALLACFFLMGIPQMQAEEQKQHTLTPEQEFAFANYRRYYKEAQQVQPAEKKTAIQQLRSYFFNNPFRVDKHFKAEPAEKYLALLTDEGQFADFKATEELFIKEDAYHKGYQNTTDDKVGIFLNQALTRIYYIGDAYRKGKISATQALDEKIWKAIIHYGMLETARPNDMPRFHASCFAIPAAAANIYFAYLKEMNQAEKGEGPSSMKQACDMLKTLGLQAYTQPLRNDDTDKNVVSIDRFKNHVWWVGGNALAYRPLLSVAAMYSSIPMVDLLSEVAQRGISMTSQSTFHEAFWTEGFTADGAGWGHGKQCLIWGYPIDGTFSALNMLGMLKGTPWAKSLSKENVDALMNFMRGGNWYYYKGFRLPGLDRGSYVYNPTEKDIPYLKMLNVLLRNWSGSFNAKQLDELKQLQTEAKQHRINMDGYDEGLYSGTRWFFNNDDLTKKNKDYHLHINMASVRCDGLESAAFADNYNFCPTDGATLFQRNGDEYFRVMGGWDVLSLPGVTARQGMNQLKPVTNWRGYCSRHNFAAGATYGGENAVAGYIFEKINGNMKKDSHAALKAEKENPILYGVKAHKSYFILGDYMIALGAGITNLNPEMEGRIHTTIEQTAWSSPVVVQNTNDILSAGKEKTLTAHKQKFNWISQENKFSYALLPGSAHQLHMICEKRPTMWSKLNPSNKNKKDLPESVSTLRLWIDHGQEPVNDSYGYVVYMGNGMAVNKPFFEVLRNDTLVQAIRTHKQNVTEAVFYDANSQLKAKGLTLKVSAPCAVLIEKNQKKQTITVTDATMNADLREIIVTLNGKTYPIALPQGMLCGKPATLTID